MAGRTGHDAAAGPEEFTETWGQQSRRLSCVVALDLDELILFVDCAVQTRWIICSTSRPHATSVTPKRDCSGASQRLKWW